MTPKAIMQAEAERVRTIISEAVDQIEAEGGNLQFFSAAMLTAALELHVELEGLESLDRAITKIGMREMQRRGVKPC
jgi:hypothetical protein